MPTSLSGRHFLRLLDFSTEEIEYLLKLSKNFKDMKRAGVPHRYLEGKNIVLLFQKTSTRTRCAFEVGAMDLGMGVTYLDPGSSQMGKKESIEDTARVLGRFYDVHKGSVKVDGIDVRDQKLKPLRRSFTAPDGTVYTLRHEMLAAQVVTDDGAVVYSEPGWANVLKPLLALAGLYVIFAAGYIALDRFTTLEATGHLDQV